MSRELDVVALPLHGLHLIEASAGTGKTYNIALLYLRLLLERDLGVRGIAVVTFTDAATRELRGRLRARLAEAVERLRDGPREPADDLDRVLAPHRRDGEALAGARTRLDSALVGFDEAIVSTLHGLCRQLLGELAFESGMPFIELDGESIGDAALELVRDYWRRHLVAEPVAFADDVLARWPDPEALASHLVRSQALALPAACVDPVDPQAWLEASAEAQANALAGWHALLAEGAPTRAVASLRRAVADKLLSSAKVGLYADAALAACEQALADAAPGMPDLQRLAPLQSSSIVAARLAKADKLGWQPEGELDEVARSLQLLVDASAVRANALIAAFLRDVLGFVGDGLAARRERLRRFGFDDLVRGMHAQLHGERGEVVARQLAASLPAILVDEFQDTDPLQYAILERIHAASVDSALFLIGDPKQAIYRFRGGDIFTYRNAARRAAASTHTLRDNRRSDRRLIEAMNALFGGARDPFLYDFIGFEEARFPAAREPGSHWLEDAAPLVVWRLPDRASDKGKRKPWTIDDFSDRVLAETSATIKALLRQGAERGDGALAIAVLVNTNRQAEETARALSHWNIACDYLSTASVHSGDEALELATIVAALCAPGDAAVVRAALATELLGETHASLLAANADLDAWEAQLARIARLRARWLEAGPYAALAPCVQAAAVRLLPRWDGRRRVTNFLHLAELLQHEARRRGTPEELLHWLSERRAEAIARRGEGHAEILRPADDPGAVQVLTIHRSKGLQYDAVFAPFLLGTRWSDPRNARAPDEAVAWHDDDALRIDVGGPDWVEHALMHRNEQFAESLRLAYVAITRARHRVWLAWAFANTGKRNDSRIGPLAWLWLRGASMKAPADLVELDLDQVDAALATLAARSNGSIVIKPIGEAAPAIDAAPIAQARRCLPEPSFHGYIDRRFETLSYSRLFGGSLHAPAADHDEAESGAVPALPADDAEAVPQKPRGAEFGNCMHELFEKIPFAELAAPALPARLVRICADHGYPPTVHALIGAMARATVATELLPGSGLRLAALGAADVLAELEFLFPLGSTRLDALERILAREARHARAPGELSLRREEVVGLMTGFIDLVLRWQGRYYVLDYKTNLLGATRADYAVERLPAAIRAHDYDLQYLIYLVALQRFLRARLGDAYDFDRHIGGALYLFVRGMREGERAGIHYDRPARELIDAIDAWFTGAAP